MKGHQEVISAAERELGRVDAAVDPQAGAAMLLGACFQRAYFSAMTGTPITAAERTHFAANLVTCLLRAPHELDP